MYCILITYSSNPFFVFLLLYRLLADVIYASSLPNLYVLLVSLFSHLSSFTILGFICCSGIFPPTQLIAVMTAV
jgi:hypothetical protein